MPKDETLTPTPKFGRPPTPGTEGTDELVVDELAADVAGADAAFEAGGAAMVTVAASSFAGLISAKRFEIEIKEKVSKSALKKVILLKTVLLTSNENSQGMGSRIAGYPAIMGSPVERVK